jgi:hypothetical protein
MYFLCNVCKNARMDSFAAACVVAAVVACVLAAAVFATVFVTVSDRSADHWYLVRGIAASARAKSSPLPLDPRAILPNPMPVREAKQVPQQVQGQVQGHEPEQVQGQVQRHEPEQVQGQVQGQTEEHVQEQGYRRAGPRRLAGSLSVQVRLKEAQRRRALVQLPPRARRGRNPALPPLRPSNTVHVPSRRRSERILHL